MRSSAATAFVALAVTGACIHDLQAQQKVAPAPSFETAYNYALAIVLDGRKTGIVDKLVGPVRAILVCRDAELRKLAHQAVAEVNDAFGYGKIAVQDTENTRLEDDSITILIGSKRESRQLVKDFGVSSPRAFRGATYYYWWDPRRRNHIRRGVIAIDKTASQEELSDDLKHLLLACMGVESPWDAHLNHPGSRGQKTEESSIFSEFSVAVLRFFDKHVEPGATAHDMRNTFKREWPDFSSAYWNPANQKAATSTEVSPSGVR